MDIKIYQTFHKPFTRVNDCNWLLPIGVNGYSEQNWLTDNNGDNISHLNKYYCELTTMYYVWKNQKHDYVGFYHYRRYLNYIIDNTWVDFPFAKINQDISMMRYMTSNMQYDRIIRLLKVSPVITTFPFPVFPNINDQYVGIHSEAKDTWYLFLSYLIKDGHDPVLVHHYFNELCKCPMYNTFVMRWDIFNDYCLNLFNLLDRITKQIGFPFNEYNNRYPGFIAERYLGYYLHYKNINSTNVVCVHVE